MSRNPKLAIKKFLDCLRLQKIADNTYQAHSPDYGWRQVFGGQFVAQSVVAAQKTVSEDRFIHSLHSYFVRPGNPSLPTIYKVERVRDGASFTLRSIRAEQAGHLVFMMQASFQKFEYGLEHQAQMPDVAMPEDIDLEDLWRRSKGEHIAPLKDYIYRERPFEFRPLSVERYIGPHEMEPVHSIWLRLFEKVPQVYDEALSAAMLAYVSDAMLIDTALFPHSTHIFDKQIRGASLDHSIWFHRPFSFDDWVLYHMDSPVAGGARGFARGSFYSRDGLLLATIAQEGLIRKRAND